MFFLKSLDLNLWFIFAEIEIRSAFKLNDDQFIETYGFPKPLPEDKNVVLTSFSGQRAKLAWDQLRPMGYCNIR